MDSLPNISREPTPPTQAALAQPIVARPLEVQVRPWSIVGQLVIGVLLVLAAQVLLAFGVAVFLGIGAGVRGAAPDPAEIGRNVAAFLAGPTGISPSILLNEAVFLGVALYCVRRLSGTKRENLGLPRPALPLSAYLLFAVASAGVALLGDLLASPVNELIPSMMDAQKLRSQVTWATGIPFVIIIALAPGFVEELLFRGYVQRRLLLCWRPRSAILFASVAFAMAHLDPVHVVFALPLGIWLGILAWRTNSIWPGVAGHVFVNALFNIWGICVAQLAISDAAGTAVTVIAAVCAVVGFVGSIFVLRRMPPPSVVPAEAVCPPPPTAV